MIATGNHNFERFAALCNTPEVESRAAKAALHGKVYYSALPPYSSLPAKNTRFSL